MNRHHIITNYKNSYIPKVRHPLNSYVNLNLGECLAKHEAERFVEDPKAYLDSTYDDMGKRSPHRP